MKTASELIAFEQRVRDEFAAGKLPFLLHLCGGNEDQLIDVFKGVRPGDWIFSTHRSHYHYLLAGGSEERLMELIRAGRSMFVYDKALNFLTSSVLGGMCAVAAGVAWAIQRRDFESGTDSTQRVWCFVGDGAEDNGHLYEAVMWVEGQQLPCTFIIEDNGMSVDSSTEIRTGGFRMKWPSCVQRIVYERTYPHAGPGLKTMVGFDHEIVSKHASKEAIS